MSCLPKPVLRGHIARKGIRNIIAALSLAVFNSSMYYFFVTVPHKKSYTDFLKTYDADAHFRDLDKWGYLNYKAVLSEAFGKE